MECLLVVAVHRLLLSRRRNSEDRPMDLYHKDITNKVIPRDHLSLWDTVPIASTIQMICKECTMPSLKCRNEECKMTQSISTC